MKLIIQIPCHNERDQLAGTFEDLPREVSGIDEIEVLVIDDGSTDHTSQLAEAIGVHHIVRFPRHRGLAAAHMAGLGSCLRLGADVVVNTDADNQYRGEDIGALIQPILEGRADVTVGDRQTDHIDHFSVSKRLLQRLGSKLVQRISGTNVADSTSGFRGFNRSALSSLFVHNDFSYTVETIIQAGQSGLAIENVPIATNPPTRPSRLFTSIPDYLKRNGPVIFRSYSMYWPAQTFGYIALGLFLIGSALVVRFLYYFMKTPDLSSHIQSLQIGVGAIVIAFIVGLMALLGDLIAANRRIMEELLTRVRRLGAQAVAHNETLRQGPDDNVQSTGAESWRSRQ